MVLTGNQIEVALAVEVVVGVMVDVVGVVMDDDNRLFETTSLNLFPVDGNVYGISVIEEGTTAAGFLDPRHVSPRSDGVSRLNLSPDPSATEDSSVVRRNCSSGDPGVLFQRAARAAIGGSPTEHVDNAGRNMESGGHLPPNSHENAHASLGERGTSVVRSVEPREFVAVNLESGEQHPTHSLKSCSHVNPLDLDPRNTEVHAAVRRSERGSSPSGNVRVLSTGSVRHYGQEENFGAFQKRHLSGEGRQA
ncbi:hypothetical protein Ancab_011158, partial [Ancistrocladus abbreviatus]